MRPDEPIESNDRKVGLCVVLVPAILALLAHAWSLWQPFLAEDFTLIAANYDGLSSFDSQLFFRPLVDAAILFDYWLHGVEPFGYHVTNLVMFAAVVALSAALAWRMVGDAFVGLLTGALLALSPLVPEDVVWVAGRDGLIPLLLVLVAAHAMLADRSGLRVTGALVFFCGLFAKEWVVAAAPVLVALRAVARRGDLRTAFRETVLVWPAIVTYIAVRVAVLGELVGGYGEDGVAGGEEPGVLERWLEYLTALLVQVPEVTVSGMARVAIAVAVVLVVALGLRAANRVHRSPIGGVVACCSLWILTVMIVHTPVHVDARTLADARYLWPALPPVCVLFALTCSAWPRMRLWIALTLLAISSAGLVGSSREFAAAGRVSEAIRTAAVDLARADGTVKLVVSGIPPILGRAHLGICLHAAFGPPFYSAVETPIVTHQDFYVPHLGKRRTAGFVFMRDAVRNPVPGLRHAGFDRDSLTIRPVPDPGARFVLRGRMGDLGRLQCSRVALDWSASKPPPRSDASVALHGRFVDDPAGRRFRVESVATSSTEVLSIRSLQDSSGSKELAIEGAPGSYYSVFVAPRPAAHALPGYGVLLVDTGKAAIVGKLDSTGRLRQVLPVPGGARFFAQVALFTPAGEVILSRCECAE